MYGHWYTTHCTIHWLWCVRRPGRVFPPRQWSPVLIPSCCNSAAKAHRWYFIVGSYMNTQTSSLFHTLHSVLYYTSVIRFLVSLTFTSMYVYVHNFSRPLLIVSLVNHIHSARSSSAPLVVVLPFLFTTSPQYRCLYTYNRIIDGVMPRLGKLMDEATPFVCCCLDRCWLFIILHHPDVSH